MMKKGLLAMFILCCVAGCGPVAEHHEAEPQAEVPEDLVSTEDFEEGELEEPEELEIPPEGALPLSEIIASLEVGDHTTIIEVEYEDGVWEVEYVVGDEEHEILVDPMTGEPLPEEDDEEDEAE